MGGPLGRWAAGGWVHGGGWWVGGGRAGVFAVFFQGVWVELGGWVTQF